MIGRTYFANRTRASTMEARSLLRTIAFVLLSVGGCATDPRSAVPFTRYAELEIYPSQLGQYLAAVKEEMATSVRIEPGVLAIYAVADTENPAKLRFFEIYADEAAFRAHIASPHFKKYVETTQSMIRSRGLHDTVPVQLSDKAGRYELR
jgi:quinol monooxygenase YgiN